MEVAAPSSEPRSVTIVNEASTRAFLSWGDDGVTSSRAIPLPSRGSITLVTQDEITAISESGTGDLRVYETLGFVPPSFATADVPDRSAREVGVVSLAGTSSLAQSQKTLNNGAETQLAAASSATRRAILIVNHSTTTDVYLGATGVTAANGVKLVAGGSLVVETKAAVYAFVAAAGIVLGVMELT